MEDAFYCVFGRGRHNLDTEKRHRRHKRLKGAAVLYTIVSKKS